MRITKRNSQTARHMPRCGEWGKGGSNIIAGLPPQMSSPNDVREASRERKTRAVDSGGGAAWWGESTHTLTLVAA